MDDKETNYAVIGAPNSTQPRAANFKQLLRVVDILNIFTISRVELDALVTPLV